MTYDGDGRTVRVALALAIQKAQNKGRTTFRSDTMIARMMDFISGRMGDRGRLLIREAYEEGKRVGLSGVGGPYGPSYDKLLTEAASRMGLKHGKDRSGNT